MGRFNYLLPESLVKRHKKIILEKSDCFVDTKGLKYSYEHLRKSNEPISKRGFYCLVDYSNESDIPDIIKNDPKYHQYTNNEIRDKLGNDPKWDEMAQFKEIHESYDIDEIRRLIYNGGYIEAVVRVHLCVSALIKKKIKVHFRDQYFFNDSAKRNIFYQDLFKLQKSDRILIKEAFVLGLINEDELKSIETFLDLRNNVVHKIKNDYEKRYIQDQIEEMDLFLENNKEELI